MEFWDRKAQCQAEWFEKGFELERKWQQEREENIRARQSEVGKIREGNFYFCYTVVK